MIERYTRPEMAHIWSEENKYRQWLEVELAASEALAETNDVPPEAARALRKHASFDLKRIHDNRARGEARCHRIHHRGFREPGRGRRGGRVALAALRPDVE